MRFHPRSKMSIGFSLIALVVIVGSLFVTGALLGSAPQAHAAAATSPHAFINCSTGQVSCVEVFDSDRTFGHYVGHDEPSNLFYSNTPGSGNQMRYTLTLPSDPPPTAPLTPGKSFNFELHPAFWFGMAMCDTQSYPEQVSTCTPDSDTNIVDPTVSPKHPGSAFMEMQFYPPGWVKWPAGGTTAGVGGTSCDPTRWCAALNIDSLSENPVNGTVLNPTCAAHTGLEYINFAFITTDGHPTAPPNPVDSTLATFTPNPARDLFMNSGDKLAVTLHDTAHGLQIIINDQTTGQSGSMTSSAANGFGQVKFAPKPSTACKNIPYDFHPMYSTSSENTRVIWAAHTYNVAFSDEIGHFDYCNGATIPSSLHGVACPKGNTEGIGTTVEPTDGDDANCFPASRSSLVQLPGCTFTNDPGFDGVPYLPVWPDGNTILHPTPIQFTSPLTGSGYTENYPRSAFEVDLPAIESSSIIPCNVLTGAHCTLIPLTDDCTTSKPISCVPAAFYPFYDITNVGGQCVWQLGNHIPGDTNDFHQNQQYGTLVSGSYLNGGNTSINAYENFRQIFSHNPCPA
jgi:hypothetical protein